MSLPLLVCLLLPEPEGIVVCMDTMNFVSHVVECPATVSVYSGEVYAGGGRYSTVFENMSFPSAREAPARRGLSGWFTSLRGKRRAFLCTVAKSIVKNVPAR